MTPKKLAGTFALVAAALTSGCVVAPLPYEGQGAYPGTYNPYYAPVAVPLPYLVPYYGHEHRHYR